MKQMDLLLAPPAARHTDPATSQAAARRAVAFQESHAGRIHEALKRAGRATAHELATATGLTVVQVEQAVCQPITRSGVSAHVANGAPT